MILCGAGNLQLSACRHHSEVFGCPRPNESGEEMRKIRDDVDDQNTVSRAATALRVVRGDVGFASLLEIDQAEKGCDGGYECWSLQYSLGVGY